jgi:hypothetical protein
MSLPTETLTVLVVASLAASLLALAILALGGGRRRMREPGGPLRLDEALRTILDGQSERIARLEQAVRALAATDRRQEGLLRSSVRRVALVRYDAFEDVGGRLSFSCALLDDHGDGVVLTSINGRQDTRVYAKPVTAGRSPHNLSAEEREAIKRALQGPGEDGRAGGARVGSGPGEAVSAG